MKHTKGNWEYIGHIASDRTHFVRKVMSGTISICVIRTNNQEQAEANAKLIAAAPELLEVLQTIENDNNQIPDWLWIRIKLAIRKATK